MNTNPAAFTFERSPNSLSASNRPDFERCRRDADNYDGSMTSDRWSSRLSVVAMICYLAVMQFPAEAGTDAGWFYRAWQTDDGLPANSVTGLSQTPDGCLWVATHSGLARFDGVKFREVNLPIPSGRINPLIRCLTQDRAQRLWLALEGGIVVNLGKEAGNVRLFTTTNGLPNFRPLSLAPSSDGAVWISYADGSACRIAGDEVTRFTARDGLTGTGQCMLANDTAGNIWFAKAGQCGLLDATAAKRLFALPPGVTRLGAAREGGVWICSGRTLLRVASTTNTPVEVGEIPATSPGIEPAALYEDRAGALWIATLAGGLFRYEGQQFQHINTSHPDVLALTGDREGNLWAGTDGGGLDRVRQRMLELQDSDEGLPISTLRSICEDGLGRMWAVAQNGELSRLHAGRWQRVAHEEGWSGARALCVTGDGGKGAWVGSYHAGLHHWDGTNWTVWQASDGLGGEVVRGLMRDRKGDLWLAIEGVTCVQRLRNGRFETFTQPTNSRPARALVEDAKGNVWFGTVGGFLLRAEGDHLVDETARTLATPKPVRCLLATADGSLWIGYAGAGVGRLKDNRFKRISTAEGLPDTYISAMESDDGGNFWMASDRGIFKVRQRELEAVAEGTAVQVRVVSYGRDEGLSNLQGNYGYEPGSARSRDGRIWFPTRAGLAVIQPGHIDPKRMPPPVTLEQIAVDGLTAELNPGVLLRIKPQHRRIEIEYTAFGFTAPEQIEFRRWLEGWEEGWTDGDTERRVNYTRLPAGRYTFHVQARAGAGEWSGTEAALAFAVEPFLRQRWWFLAASVVWFTLVVIGVVRYVSFRRLRLKLARLEQEAALQKERTRIAKDIHDDLGASLTQISLLSKLGQHDLGEHEKLSGHLQNIATAARDGVKAVDEIVWAVNPRNDTVAHLLDYAGQYAVDFLRNADIRCRVDFPVQVPPLELTSDTRHGLFLVVKESLNNIVKHAGATDVLVRAGIENGRLRLAIEDNGHGFASAPDNALSDGLRNMQQRLAELGGSCRIESSPGRGTTVSVSLPLAGGLPKASQLGPHKS